LSPLDPKRTLLRLLTVRGATAARSGIAAVDDPPMSALGAKLYIGAFANDFRLCLSAAPLSFAPSRPANEGSVAMRLFGEVEVAVGVRREEVRRIVSYLQGV
jgi:hypothetical protein